MFGGAARGVIGCVYEKREGCFWGGGARRDCLFGFLGLKEGRELQMGVTSFQASLSKVLWWFFFFFSLLPL